jgi:hypothetical protein
VSPAEAVSPVATPTPSCCTVSPTQPVSPVAAPTVITRFVCSSVDVNIIKSCNTIRGIAKQTDIYLDIARYQLVSG